ncbi:MAG: hypothetical protein LBP74_06445, partial [Treponema sp.]|nr:hypothetical protein [Treponema sp.]
AFYHDAGTVRFKTNTDRIEIPGRGRRPVFSRFPFMNGALPLFISPEAIGGIVYPYTNKEFRKEQRLRRGLL